MWDSSYGMGAGHVILGFVLMVGLAVGVIALLAAAAHGASGGFSRNRERPPLSFHTEKPEQPSSDEP